ncbi:MAG: N-acetylmuramic acid 6-phosphate etherase [Phycisphaerales bacterium]|nr:N-acetylmuramic acid 6-phosphate etherase [Phycisphaerales bacterium]
MSSPNTPSSVPPDRAHLLTEQRLNASANLDAGSIIDTLSIINDADAGVAGAVRDQIESIGLAVKMVVQSLESGGRLIYLGAGTSGRLGVLDASECPPTFNSDPDQVIGIIAGGDSALRKSSEHKEDDPDGVHGQLDELGAGADDTVIGIAAGGTTPFVLGGVQYAKSLGASTGLLTCTPINQPSWCDVLIAIETGAEVITGSTRMKAGTATKMVLNMITTGAMVHSGKVYGHLMVDMRATNDKLRDRAARIISQITGLDRDASFDLLDRANRHVKPALVMHAKNLSLDQANQLLNQHHGRLRPILGDPS